MSAENDARLLKSAIQKIVEEEIEKRLGGALVIRKAVGVSADTSAHTMVVRYVGETETFTLPYSASALPDGTFSAGCYLVAMYGGSARGAFVWKKLRQNGVE